jgi:hypothetical protein
LLRRGPRAYGLIVCVVALAITAATVAGVGGRSREPPGPPAPPEDAAVSFNFQGGPDLVFICWSPGGNDVNFYDLELLRWENGQPRQEVRYGVTTSACGGGLGAGEYMYSPDLYHYAVRACNNGGCSSWADATSPDRYWTAVPCGDPTGDSCSVPLDVGAGP